MTEHFIESFFTKPDVEFDQSLRPQTLLEFVGQDRVSEQLDVMIKAATLRKEPLGHILFSGPPGLGKTSLSFVVASSLKTRLVVTSGPVIERPADLAIELSKLKDGEILFIDEIHRMNRVVEEYLYSAMEDFVLDIPQSTRVPLAHFTLIGATTRPGLLSSPFRSRFFYTARLDFYDVASLVKILERSSRLIQLQAPKVCLEEIAKRSRGTPRIANRLLRWVRDYASVKAGGVVTKELVKEALDSLQIDEKGLDEMDFRLLHSIVHKFDGGPVGIQTLAACVSEEAETIEEMHEPYLISCGFLNKTPKGREVTSLGCEHVSKASTMRKTR